MKHQSWQMQVEAKGTIDCNPEQFCNSLHLLYFPDGKRKGGKTALPTNQIMGTELILFNAHSK
jgi:hypothetical protein